MSGSICLDLETTNVYSIQEWLFDVLNECQTQLISRDFVAVFTATWPGRIEKHFLNMSALAVDADRTFRDALGIRNNSGLIEIQFTNSNPIPFNLNVLMEDGSKKSILIGDPFHNLSTVEINANIRRVVFGEEGNEPTFENGGYGRVKQQCSNGSLDIDPLVSNNCTRDDNVPEESRFTTTTLDYFPISSISCRIYRRDFVMIKSSRKC